MKLHTSSLRVDIHPCTGGGVNTAQLKDRSTPRFVDLLLKFPDVALSSLLERQQLVCLGSQRRRRRGQLPRQRILVSASGFQAYFLT